MQEQFKKFKKKYIFSKNYKTFLKPSTSHIKRFNVIEKRLMLEDDTANTVFDKHYIYHPAWAARILKQLNPDKHVDISSTLHFCSIVSAFIPVDFYDFRPANVCLSNLVVGKADLLSLPFKNNSVSSLSCMHTLEHIGLGRYGEKIDYDGDLKAIGELKRVLAPKGYLLIAVPIGKPKIVFNAHRIYSAAQFLSNFSELELIDFSLIPDDSSEIGILSNPTMQLCDEQEYACGCFLFRN